MTPLSWKQYKPDRSTGFVGAQPVVDGCSATERLDEMMAMCISPEASILTCFERCAASSVG